MRKVKPFDIRKLIVLIYVHNNKNAFPFWTGVLECLRIEKKGKVRRIVSNMIATGLASCRF